MKREAVELARRIWSRWERTPGKILLSEVIESELAPYLRVIETVNGLLRDGVPVPTAIYEAVRAISSAPSAPQEPQKRGCGLCEGKGNRQFRDAKPPGICECVWRRLEALEARQ